MTIEIKTPSQIIIEKANAIFEVSDEIGRKIKIKKPDILDEMRLLEIVGHLYSNAPLMAIYSLLMYVVSIDGIIFNIGLSKTELDAALKRLDRHGFKALQIGIAEHFKDDVIADTEGNKEEIKK